MRRVALAALAAAAAAFVVRAVATFRPGTFGQPAAAVAGLGLFALSALALAVFFIAVQRHYGAPGRAGLRVAAAGAALGWLAVSALHAARAVAIVDPGLAALVPSAAAAPFAATALSALFLAALVAEARGGRLERPAFAGLLGTLAMALAEAVVLVRLASAAAADRLPEPTRDLAVVLSPLGVGAFAAVVWFLWAFAREAGGDRA